MAFSYIYENSFQGVFFIVCVASEIFSNISGISLIVLLWKTEFLLPHGIYIVGCKVGIEQHIKKFTQILIYTSGINCLFVDVFLSMYLVIANHN